MQPHSSRVFCRGNHNTIFHYADFNGYAVDKPGLREPISTEVNGAAFNEGVKLAVGEVGYGSWGEGVAMGQPPMSDFSLSLAAKSDGVWTTDSLIPVHLLMTRWPPLRG